MEHGKHSFFMHHIVGLGCMMNLESPDPLKIKILLNFVRDKMAISRLIVAPENLGVAAVPQPIMLKSDARHELYT